MKKRIILVIMSLLLGIFFGALIQDHLTPVKTITKTEVYYRWTNTRVCTALKVSNPHCISLKDAKKQSTPSKVFDYRGKA